MIDVTQERIFALIADINAFVDNAEEHVQALNQTYEKEKQTLVSNHEVDLKKLQMAYQANDSALQLRAGHIICEAKEVLTEIQMLDERLSMIDKFYVKTKKKRADALFAITSKFYSSGQDYSQTLHQIKAEYQRLTKKYSEEILPVLINGLSFFFSAQRKKDYDELIILNNTVTAFLTEIADTLPQVASENQAAIQKHYIEQREEIIAKQRIEVAAFEERVDKKHSDLAEKLCARLDELLPDTMVDYIYQLATRYKTDFGKVNITKVVPGGIVSMCYIDYPVDVFVHSPVISALIKEKCAKVLADGNNIRLPLIMSLQEATPWFICCDRGNATMVQKLTHTVMVAYLSACPVSSLSYVIVDPENQGGSISPFLEAMKKLPELFGDKVCITREDIGRQIDILNDYIEDTLLNKLGIRYANIFDYAMEHPEDEIRYVLLLLFDFPKGMDEQGFTGLRNILRNGQRCGIFTVIIHTKQAECSAHDAQGIQSIETLSRVLEQNDQTLTMRGLSVTYLPMPQKVTFDKFFSKYMLTYEGIRNRGIAFLPLTKHRNAGEPVVLD